MLHAFLVVLALQVVGDLIADLLTIPVPGMVIGLVLLLAGLGLRRRWLGPERAVPQAIQQLAKGLHDNFGLLFVPAGVGVVANFHRIATDAPALLATILLSTVLTIAVTALIAAERSNTVRAVDTTPAE
jgi:holin-like protein